MLDPGHDRQLVQWPRFRAGKFCVCMNVNVVHVRIYEDSKYPLCTSIASTILVSVKIRDGFKADFRKTDVGIRYQHCSTEVFPDSFIFLLSHLVNIVHSAHLFSWVEVWVSYQEQSVALLHLQCGCVSTGILHSRDHPLQNSIREA